MPKIENDLNGWLVIDKPYGMGSTQVVTKLKRLLHPKKIGHAGTLDPLATGVLAIALGKATKTIEFVMDAPKTYQFIVKWGSETSTDDAEGEIVASSEKRPTVDEIRNILPAFQGSIQQVPPAYSAIKINGVRAYKLARTGQDVDMKPRQVYIDRLSILAGHMKCCSIVMRGDADVEGQPETLFEVVCGKGTYVRSLAHDMGRKLGCYGHIKMLRRTKCGPFAVDESILLANMEKNDYNTNALSIIPVRAALSDISVLAVNRDQAGLIIQGRSVKVDDLNEEIRMEESSDRVFGISYLEQMIALAKITNGDVRPFKVLIDHL